MSDPIGKIFKVKAPLSWSYHGYIEMGGVYHHIFEDGAGHYMTIDTNSPRAPALGPSGDS